MAWTGKAAATLLVMAIVLGLPARAAEDMGQDFHVDVDGISVSAGGHHVCALEYRPGIELGGPARCWGYSHHGQAKPPEGSTFVQISAGTYYTCGILDTQQVRCWGRRIDPPAGRFLQISVGEWHVCGIQEDGRAVCWGRNDNKQSEVPEGERFLQIAAGQDITCGLRTSGTILCWGEQVDQPFPAALYKQVAVGSSLRICGLTLETSSLQCWGKEREGLIEEEGPFVQISTSPHRTCAIREEGRALWCMDDTTAKMAPELRDLGWAEISVGGEHVCGVTEDDGALHCFANHMTLFGDATVSSPEEFTTA